MFFFAEFGGELKCWSWRTWEWLPGSMRRFRKGEIELFSGEPCWNWCVCVYIMISFTCWDGQFGREQFEMEGMHKSVWWVAFGGTVSYFKVMFTSEFVAIFGRTVSPMVFEDFSHQRLTLPNKRDPAPKRLILLQHWRVYFEEMNVSRHV